ncbi:MAG TPA: DUF2130 domain-containing protein [Allosphingosinicella sp.]|jgi:hypothetical protein
MASQHRPAAPAFPNMRDAAHLHAQGDTCPLCEQPIPDDRAEEVANRLEALERDRTAEISARLEARFAADKAEALAAAEQQAAAQIAAARETVRAEAKEAVAAADRARQEAETDKAKADADRAGLQARLDEAREAAETAVAAVKAEAAAKEEEIRAEAKRAADEAARIRISEAEGKVAASQEASAALQTELARSREAHAAKIEQMQQDAAFKESEIRSEAQKVADAAAAAALAAAERARQEAETKAASAEAQAAVAQQAYEQRLAELREALEADKTTAVNEMKSAAFEERLKWQGEVEKLKRRLEEKSIEERGEGAHINLLEDLKAAFGEDRIERIARGQAGADIRHTVMHNGKACGTLLYDSKNHGAWRNDFVTKLKSDQLADKADHALLVTSAFPSGKRNVCVQDDVVVVSPAQAVALVQILRRHLVQNHALRMSNTERAQKTVALYAFITSQRCVNLLARFESDAAKLLELQANEKKQHDLNWQKQGLLFCSIQKTQGDLRHAIDTIIGTAEEAGEDGDEAR